MTLIAIAGDVHGDIVLLYEKVVEIQAKIGAPIEAVFQVGDLHLYSDTSRIDSAVLRHGGAGEFPTWFREKRAIPIPTYAILGNHDDAELFYQYAGREIVPSLHLLSQGIVTSIKVGGVDVRIGVLGGNYSQKFFKTDPEKLPQGRKRHYTQAHIDSLINNKPFDILLTHEAPTGLVKRNDNDLGRLEITDLIERTQPQMAFFGHHHTHASDNIGKTVVTGLARIQNLGGLIVLAISKDGIFQLLRNS